MPALNLSLRIALTDSGTTIPSFTLFLQIQFCGFSNLFLRILYVILFLMLACLNPGEENKLLQCYTFVNIIDIFSSNFEEIITCCVVLGRGGWALGVLGLATAGARRGDFCVFQLDLFLTVASALAASATKPENPPNHPHEIIKCRKFTCVMCI